MIVNSVFVFSFSRKWKTKETKNFSDSNGICGLGKRREPQKHKGHKGVTAVTEMYVA
jgi:hypothetical protein